MRFIINSKIYGAILLLAIVFLTGVLGFRYLSEFSWIDVIYMTVITVTTVGFCEVKPLGPAEKIFTSVLILTSIFILGYAISVISEYLLSKNSFMNIREKRVQK